MLSAYEQNRAMQAVVYLQAARASEPIAETTIQRQREACAQYASEHGLRIMREYVEVGSPARGIGERPVLAKLLDDLDWLNDARFVIVYEHKSVARTTKVYNSVCERIELANAQLVVTSAQQADDCCAGELIIFVMGREYERGNQ